MLYKTIQKTNKWWYVFPPLALDGKKIDVEQKDKSQVGPQGKKTCAYKIQLSNDM